MAMPGIGINTQVGTNTSTFGTLFNPGNAPFNELSRQGVMWTVQTSSAFAPLTAVPTTTARLEIFNNSSAIGNPQTMEVIDLFTFQLLSTAATQTYSIWAQVAAEATPASTGLSVFNFGNPGGHGTYTSGANTAVVTGVGTTVVANGWRPFGTVQAWGTAAATPGNAWHAEVHGKIRVPPGASLHLQVVGSIATASSFNALGAQWAWDTGTNL